MNGETGADRLEIVGNQAWGKDGMVTSQALYASLVECWVEGEAVRAAYRDSAAVYASTQARTQALIKDLQEVMVVSRQRWAEAQARRRDEAGREAQDRFTGRIPGANALTVALTARLLGEAGLGGDGSSCPCRRCRRG